MFHAFERRQDGQQQLGGVGDMGGGGSGGGYPGYDMDLQDQHQAVSQPGGGSKPGKHPKHAENEYSIIFPRRKSSKSEDSLLTLALRLFKTDPSFANILTARQPPKMPQGRAPTPHIRPCRTIRPPCIVPDLLSSIARRLRYCAWACAHYA